MEKEKENNLTNISKIFILKGEDKNIWKNLLHEIISNNEMIYFNIISKINQSLIDNYNVDLALDIIDFIIDYGSNKIIEYISSKKFLKNVSNILSINYNSDISTKKKLIYLIKKWALKYNTNDCNSNFKEIYNKFKLKKIIFPPDELIIETYTKYISKDECELEFKKKDEINKNINIDTTIYQNPFSKENNDKNNIYNISWISESKFVLNEEAPIPNFCSKNNNEHDNKNSNDSDLNKNIENIDNSIGSMSKNNKIGNNYSPEMINLIINQKNSNENKNIIKNINNLNENKIDINNQNKNINIFNENNFKNNHNQKIGNNDQFDKNSINQNFTKNNIFEGNNNFINNKNDNINKQNYYNNKINNKNNENNFKIQNNNNIQNDKNNNFINKNNSNEQINNDEQNNQNINNIKNNNIKQNINNYNNYNKRPQSAHYKNYNNQNKNILFNNNNYNNIYNNKNMNNFNNNYYSNYNNIQNNNNQYIDNKNYNMNNFNNYYNSNNNNNKNNNKFNINNKGLSPENRPYNNNYINFSNKLNNMENNMNSFDIDNFKLNLGNKLQKINQWIDKGKFSYYNTYQDQLKEEINNIRNEIPKCDNLMNKFSQFNDTYKYEIINKLKMDIFQTYLRYEDLINGKIVPKFLSSFKK